MLTNFFCLQIYSPYVRYDSPVPVVVLIDTPTLLGGNQKPLIPTPNITKEMEVLFVRPNFRLGVLGFLAAETLSRSTHPPRYDTMIYNNMIAVAQ